MSPIPRNRWDADGKIGRSSNSYGRWAGEAALQGKTLFIDLNEIIADHYETVGRKVVESKYFNPTDHTHTIAAGAKANAEAVIKGIKTVNKYLGEKIPFRILYNVEKVGNTTTTSHFIVLHEFLLNNTIQKDHNLLF